MNWRKWNAGKKQRSEKASRAANARWEKYHRDRTSLTDRTDRHVEIAIRDSHRPMTVIRLRREDQGEKWGRWRPESGRPESLGAVSTYSDRGGHDDSARGIGETPLGPSGIGKLIGKYLE